MNDDREKRRQYLGENSDDVTMVVTGLPIEHVESKTIKHKYIHDDNEEQNTNRDQLTAGVNAAVIENWLLSYTDYRLISRQGFGKLAAFHSKSAHTTIAMPLVSPLLENTGTSCTRRDIDSFFANSWSVRIMPSIVPILMHSSLLTRSVLGGASVKSTLYATPFPFYSVNYFSCI